MKTTEAARTPRLMETPSAEAAESSDNRIGDHPMKSRVVFLRLLQPEQEMHRKEHKKYTAKDIAKRNRAVTFDI